MADTTYRFYVKPLTPAANEAIADSLNAHGDAAGTLELQVIVVDGASVSGVYEVPHSFLTELKRSTHRDKVRVYVQAGVGQIRPYALYTKLRRPSKAMRELMSRLMPATKV